MTVRLIDLTGWFLSIIGGMALVGWFIGNELLRTWAASNIPVKIEAAVLFVLHGMMLVAINHYKRYPTPSTFVVPVLLSLYGLVMSAWIMIAYATQSNSFIDINNQIYEVLTMTPDQAPLGTIICFVLSAINGIVLTLMRRPFLISVLLGSAIFGIAISVLAGFLLNADSLYYKSDVSTGMALPTALGFSLLGIAYILSSNTSIRDRKPI